MHKLRSKFFITALLTSLFLMSCQYSRTTQKGGGTDDDNTNNKLNSDAFLTIDLVKSYALNSCTQCHSGKKEPFLGTDQDLRSNMSDIQSEINDNHMPPKKPLNDCQKAIVNKWADLGTPDTSNVKISDLDACKDVTDITNPPVTNPVASGTPIVSGTVPVLPLPPVSSTPIVSGTPPVSAPVVISENAILNVDLIQGQVLSSCVKCHAPFKKEPTLVTIEEIRQNITDIQDDVNGNHMPPKKPLTDCQKALLNKWIELGTPDSSDIKAGQIPACHNTGTVQPPADQINVTPISLMPLNFQNVYQQVLSKKCSACHGPKGEAEYMSFESIQDIMVGDTYWMKPGKNSYVVLIMKAQTMPPDGSGYDKVTDEEADFVARWIDAGMPE